MNQSIYLRAAVTPAEAEHLDRAPERGIRSRAWLVAQIVRQWLADPNRTLVKPIALAATGYTPAELALARRREALLRKWIKARIAAKRRGESARHTTERMMRDVSAQRRVSHRTLCYWHLRHQAHGLVGLVDRRSRRASTPATATRFESPSKAA